MITTRRLALALFLAVLVLLGYTNALGFGQTFTPTPQHHVTTDECRTGMDPNDPAWWPVCKP